jgi:tetratricopeptide (TPR) repeat protein
MNNSHHEKSFLYPPRVHRSDRWVRLIPIIILVLVPIAVFWPVHGYQFLAWDDSVDVYNNPYLKVPSLDNLLHFWRSPYETLYTPLTYTIYALLAWTPKLLTANAGAGVVPDPRVYHSFSLLLHVLSVLILWRILWLLLSRTRQTETELIDNVDGLPLAWAACGGALLFAVHPIQVESVSWVAGIKDVLFGFLSLMAVWQYLVSVEAKMLAGRRHLRPGFHYGLATGAYLLALAAKPTAVVVPIMVWLLAGWGWRQTWREQLSGLWVWFIIAVAWGILTRWVQTGSTLVFEPPLWARPIIAGDAVAFYLYQLVVPLRFGPDYGRTPAYVLGHGWLFLTGLVPYVLAVWLWLKRKQLPWLAVAAAIFVVGLLPVLGFISFEFQRNSTVADRYIYLSMAGPALALAWGLTRFKKKFAAIGCVIVLGLLLVRSSRQIPYWHDTQTFFEHALRINPKSFVALNNLGFALADQGKDVDAVRLFNEALRIEPDSAVTHLNLANALVRLGKREEGIQQYFEALRLVPNYARAHTNLGLALAAEGRHLEAIEHHKEALRIEPGFAEAHNNLGYELARRGEFEEAAQHFAEALRLNPGYAGAHTNFGFALALQKRFDEAVQQFSEALRLEPTSATAHANLAGVFLQQGKLKEAELHYTEAIRLKPLYKNAHLRLSLLLASQGEFDRARYHVSEVLRMDPENKAARQILERIEYLDRSSKTQ